VNDEQSEQTWSVEGKVCVVTGGNSGIGLHTAIGLARQGARTVIVSRSRDKGLAAVEQIREAAGVEQVDLVVGDLGSRAQIRALAEELLERYPAIHVLVNNAGLWMTERVINPDGLETTFAVNHLGPFLLTNLLLERLVASAPARIVNVSSEGHRQGRLALDDLAAERGYGKIKAYCDSKLCNVLFTAELARRLEGTGVTANSLHPGVVNTNLGSNSKGVIRWVFDYVGPLFFTTPAKGARTSIHVATDPALDGVSGRYFRSSRQVKPSRAARVEADARRLWEVSAELCELQEPAASH
jgi:NAD(P)-dependent dehydrogenase (short-subunit alcohol dehydrogenase family)